MTDYAFRFAAAIAIIVVAAAVIPATLLIATHDVRTVTKTVAKDPGPPQGTITGEQVGTQLAGLTCQYWLSQTSVTLVCSK